MYGEVTAGLSSIGKSAAEGKESAERKLAGKESGNPVPGNEFAMWQVGESRPEQKERGSMGVKDRRDDRRGEEQRKERKKRERTRKTQHNPSQINEAVIVRTNTRLTTQK